METVGRHQTSSLLICGSNLIKLNLPRLQNTSMIFEDSMMIVLKHPIRGAQIRYTLDGSVQDSVSSPVFSGVVPITADALLKTRAFKKGWLGSDTETPS